MVEQVRDADKVFLAVGGGLELGERGRPRRKALLREDKLDLEGADARKARRARAQVHDAAAAREHDVEARVHAPRDDVRVLLAERVHRRARYARRAARPPPVPHHVARRHARQQQQRRHRRARPRTPRGPTLAHGRRHRKLGRVPRRLRCRWRGRLLRLCTAPAARKGCTVGSRRPHITTLSFHPVRGWLCWFGWSLRTSITPHTHTTNAHHPFPQRKKKEREGKTHTQT